MVSDLCTLFETLNFHVKNLSFENCIPDPHLRTNLADRFPNSQVSKLLGAFPDLFIVNRTDMHQGIFFARYLPLGRKLTAQQIETYKLYYPPFILLISIKEAGSQRSLRCRWIDNEKVTGLVDAISQRFPYKPSKEALVDAQKANWIV